MEVVVIDNAAVTYLIARLTYRVCALKRNRVRIFAACSVGTVIALFYPLVKPVWLGWCLRILCYFTLCAILFLGKEKIVVPSLAFLLITFCFGGAIFAIGFAITGSASTALNVRLSDVPIFAVIAGVAITYSSVKSCCAKIGRKNKIKQLCYDFSFTLFGEKLTFRGFVDTGNALKYNGVPVVVINAKSLIKKLDVESTVKLAEKSRLKTIAVRSATGDGKITLLPAERFILYIDENTHILYDVAIGTSARNVSEFGEYDALLPAEIAEAIGRSKGVVDETEKIA